MLFPYYLEDMSAVVVLHGADILQQDIAVEIFHFGFTELLLHVL